VTFKSITRSYYKGSIAALLVFDITSQQSFDDLNSWYYDLKTHSHHKLSIVLIGNKKDLASER
jgi:Ras-related protein Rab-2A